MKKRRKRKWRRRYRFKLNVGEIQSERKRGDSSSGGRVGLLVTARLLGRFPAPLSCVECQGVPEQGT